MVEVDSLRVVGGCFGLQDAIKQPSKQAASVKLRKSVPPLRKTLLLAVGQPTVCDIRMSLFGTWHLRILKVIHRRERGRDVSVWVVRPRV